MMLSALSFKQPHPSYKVDLSPDPAAAAAASNKSMVKLPDLTIEEVTHTLQFHLLGITFFCVATGGMGMLSVAKPMMSEVFSAALPAIVTSAFATKFLLSLAAGNLGGRLGWAAVSDMVGRRATFLIFTIGML